MSDLENSVRFTWQLVSQFVSWEFCRYMSAEREDSAAETDVLTFLRNMIIQRTEKSMSEITKHEIVAKFIMEMKEVRHISRMSCIIPLSESVKKIFPELEPAVSKLVHCLETFLEVLESADENRKEIMHMRIEGAINDFLEEANKLLPQPHLLQVIDSWSSENGHTHPKPAKKVIYNPMLFEKVLECLHFESITASEARLIAVSLYEDKAFEKILLSAEADPETSIDSEQFSIHSMQPEHVYSQEFAARSAQTSNDVALNPKPTNPERSDPDSLGLDNISQVPNTIPDLPDIPDVPELELDEQPPHLEPAVSTPVGSSTSYPFIHRINPVIPNLENKETHDRMQFMQSSANESHSDEHNSVEEGDVTRKFKQIYENQRLNRASADSDTSDCDKNGEIRFLTPTLFKKKKKTLKEPPKQNIVWLSDCESTNSSVITNAVNSQQTDPNWTSKNGYDSMVLAYQSKKKKPKKKVPAKKKTVRVLVSDSSDDNDPLCNLTSPAVPQQASTSAVYVDSGDEPSSKRRKLGRLYRSPNASILDFVTRRRTPSPGTSRDVQIQGGTIRRSTRKKASPHSGKDSTRRQKCKQCSKSFKTVIALRRHVFLKHTNPLVGSDSDSS